MPGIFRHPAFLQPTPGPVPPGLIPLSLSIGAKGGFSCSCTLADSVSIGAKGGFSASGSLASSLSASIGAKGGFSAAVRASTSVSIGAKGGFTCSESLTAALSISIGAEAGFVPTLPSNQGLFGGIAGFSASCVLKLPVSCTIGAKGGITAHITFPLSATIGAKGGILASESTHAPNTLTFGGVAGLKAFGSGSVPNQPQLFVFQITDPGSGYTSPPTVTITGGGGSGATFQVLLGAPGTPQAGTIIGIVTTNTGDGNYTGPISVTISGGGGSGGAATAQIQTQMSLQAAQGRPLQVRAEGYGLLTIETLTVPPQAATQSIQPPPIRQPVVQQVPPGQSTATGDFQQTFSRPQATWQESVYRALNNQPGGTGSTVSFLCPSVDETDSEWYATASMDGVTDPNTISVTFVGQSRFGIEADVLQGGTGYSGATVLTLSGNGGSGFGAQLTAVIVMGSIVAVTVQANGYGYVPPLSLVATDPGGGSGASLVAELGRQFGVGDYILWNDPTITAGVRSYEIDQITAIVPVDNTHATVTVARRAQGAPMDQAQYGSSFNMHTNAAFYRLINKLFIASANPTPGPQVCKFPWDNMTVAAVLASVPGAAAPYTVNLAPTVYLPGTTNLDPRVNPPTPGLRTMNGAAYTNLGVSGPLSVGAASVARVSVQAHESIRTVYAKVLVAPQGATPFNGDANACIVIYVCYLAPDGVTVGLIDTLVIDDGEFNSYSSSNVPDGRQMPYHALWPYTAPNADWPPNRLPQCAGALTVGGLLQLPITPSGSSTVLFTPDGAIDIIVAQTGTTTVGSNLTVTVQT